MAKVLTIVGARPQFIKAAMVSKAFKDYGQAISEIIVHTGQHYDPLMSDVFFKELNIPEPKYNLAVGSKSHGKQTAEMINGIEDVLLRESPDCILLYGDTNSTLAGALSASKLHIPIVHVEAGLRSYNKRMPEEINRLLTDHVSTLLLCPTKAAVDNLRREGVVNGVSVVGDVMLDSVLSVLGNCNKAILGKFGLKSGEYYFLTLHRAENTDSKAKLEEIFDAVSALNWKVIWPIHPRTKRVLEEFLIRLPSNILITEPLGYSDNIGLLAGAACLLTDSGGMQKEAYWVGVPCVTLRPETEWTETVDAGWNSVTGTNAGLILRAVNDIERTKTLVRPDIFGRPGANYKIAREVANLLSVN
ncbi:MAG: UDP-N-acetylglucosamine 2-epimerase (non-hydrolyzing) [Hahellaceae bacterium]|nr:UDP-N-acetylglucosamine 2-epimerase (non-hydrolyzing) [Hahellaceae bacterium]